MAEESFNDQTPNTTSPEYPGPIQMKKSEGKDAITVEGVQTELVSTYMGQFSRWESFRKPLESIWTDIYRLLFAQGKGDRIATRAKIVLPIVFQIIESAVPKMVTVVFGQPQWFSARSRSSQNPVSNEELRAHEELLRYQLDMVGYFQKFVDFFKGLFMYGTAYVYIYWKVKREWVYERTAKREDLSAFGQVIEENRLTWTKKLEYKVIERRPEIEILPIEDVYPDPDARTEESSEGFFIASSISLSALEEQSKGDYRVYDNFDKVKEMSSESSRYEDQQFKQDKRSIRGTGQPTRGMKSNNIELLTFWGREDLDGDGIKEEVQLVFANRKVLIRAVRNPFEHQKRPLIKGNLFPVAHEWWGMGLIEPVIGLINELITIRRQNLDMNNLIINRMWKVHALADVDVDTLVSSPNGIIVTGDMDGIEPIGQDPIPVSPLQMSEMIQSDIENATTPKSIQGSPSSGSLGRTAKGAQLIISQALEKFGMGAKLVEETVIKRVLVMMKQLNEQFLDSDEVLQTFYGNVLQGRLTPEQIRADLSFELLGISETIQKEATINQLTTFYTLTKDDPMVNKNPILTEMWKLMQVGIPADLVIPPVENQMASQVVTDPNTSAGTEEAVINQVQRNGTVAPPQIPQ